MNDYLFLEEETGGFFANVVIRIDELGIYEIARCKIDTGCAKTNLCACECSVRAPSIASLEEVLKALEIKVLGIFFYKHNLV